MQRNQGRGTGIAGGPHWHKQTHRDLPLSNPATAKQQQQQVYPAHSLPHPHQHKVVGSGGGGGIPSQIPVMPPHVMTIGGRPVNSMATMLPIYKPSSSSSIAMQQLPPKVPALHGIGDGVGEIRPHIQASVGQKMLPLGHSVAVPVTTASPSQMNLGDITTTSMSLSDLAPRVESLGFPASSSFVIGTVERYFSARLEPGSEDSSRKMRDNLIGLIDMFIFQRESSLAPPTASVLTERLRESDPLSAAAEVQLLVAIHKHLEDQPDLSLRYCVFDAIFGGISDNSCSEFDLVCKLVSLSISLESKRVLLCASIWMSTHTLGALALAGYLFREFCVLLPNAATPLAKLASHSPHLAYQLASAFTTLHPFHVVGKLLPGVDTSSLQPPASMVNIVSEWVESSPDFLYATPHHRDTIHTKFPLLHSHSKETHVHILQLPITGIIQWCVLAPLVESTMANKGNEIEEGKSGPRYHSGPKLTDSKITSSKIPGVKETGSKEASSEENTTKESDNQGRLARLHAEVLSALLSVGHTSSSPHPSLLTSDDVAIIVATLLAFSQKQEVEKKTTKAVKHEVRWEVKQEVKKEVGDCGGDASMEQCVERFSQFLQISLSTKVLQLKPEDLKSIASTLPKNRLLELVISHCIQQLSGSQ